MKPKQIERGVTTILKALGLPLEDPHLTGTPKRVGEFFKEMCRNVGKSWEQIIFDLNFVPFDTTLDQMIVVKDIRTYGLCPHHLSIVSYVAHVAYVPNRKIIGLSKIPRIVEEMSKSLMLQEDLTENIARGVAYALQDTKYITDASRRFPKGVAVVLQGEHNCMNARGAKLHESGVITSSVKGVFRDPRENARMEFLHFLQMK